MTYLHPDLSYATIKRCAGGDKVYLCNVDTIKRLGLDVGEPKIVEFTYKRHVADVKPEVDRVKKWNRRRPSKVRKIERRSPLRSPMTDCAKAEPHRRRSQQSNL